MSRDWVYPEYGVIRDWGKSEIEETYSTLHFTAAYLCLKCGTVYPTVHATPYNGPDEKVVGKHCPPSWDGCDSYAKAVLLSDGYLWYDE